MPLKFLIVLAALPGFLLAADPAAVAQQSPPEQRVAVAERNVKAAPQSSQSSQAYNDLAFALCRLARDREDVKIYDRAQAAIDRSFQSAKGNFDAQKLQVEVLLGKRMLADALQLATDLNHKVPDDIFVRGVLVDIDIALGNYPDAESEAQWILDLRAGSSLGFIEAAGLRELFGDAEGASEFYNEANRRTSPGDPDERAWLLTQNARVNITAGNLKGAEDLLKQAQALFPGSQLALGAMANLRLAEGKAGEAETLFEKRYKAVPNTANLYDWATALDLSSAHDRATNAFSEFEAKARAEMNLPYNANRDLIFFYTDRKNKPGEALALAERESAIRHDSATLDAYAWALYSNGKYSEAKTQMDRALAVGVREAAYFCHAAQISARANDAAGEQKFVHELTSFSGNSCPVKPLTESAREVSR